MCILDRKRAELQRRFADVFCSRHRYRKFALTLVSRTGFSLLEMMIGLALTVLLLQGMCSLLSTSVLSWRSSVARTEVHQSIRLAVETMTRELRFASTIAWPPPGQADNRISFRKTETNGQQNTMGFQQGLSSGQNRYTLYRTTAQGQPTPLTQNVVSSLQFEYDEPRLIKINMTVTDSETGISESLSTAITYVNGTE